MVHKPRNSLLAVGVSKYSRSQVIAKRVLYKRKPAGAVAIDAQLNDAYFARTKAAKKAATEEAFFEGEKKKEPLAENKVALQKATDKVILEAVNKVEHLRQYLSAKFSLSKGQAPHALQF
ncbi:hypothetical protein BGX24_004199 [Mortierella sp. AD032]|nr:hypothetical protein BGX24_004199 [Mortierella sp. AD032]